MADKFVAGNRLGRAGSRACLGHWWQGAGGTWGEHISEQQDASAPRPYQLAAAAAASTRSSPDVLSHERRDRARAVLQTAEAYTAAREHEASPAGAHRGGSGHVATSASELYALPYASRILYLLRQGFSDEEVLRDAELVEARIEMQDIELARHVFNMPRPVHPSIHAATSPAAPSAGAGPQHWWSPSLNNGAHAVPTPTGYPHSTSAQVSLHRLRVILAKLSRYSN